jgi:hypothetical protein
MNKGKKASETFDITLEATFSNMKGGKKVPVGGYTERSQTSIQNNTKS